MDTAEKKALDDLRHDIQQHGGLKNSQARRALDELMDLLPESGKRTEDRKRAMDLRYNLSKNVIALTTDDCYWVLDTIEDLLKPPPIPTNENWIVLKKWKDWDHNADTWIDDKSLVGVVLLDNNGVEYLVGEINERGGACNCCSSYPNKIVAWKRVYTPKER